MMINPSPSDQTSGLLIGGVVGTSTEEKCEKPKKRNWELWSMDDKRLFFEALNEYGKDFDAIQNYLASKLKIKDTKSNKTTSSATIGTTQIISSGGSNNPSGNNMYTQLFVTKNKDQVRHFYYRTWNKISKHLIFPPGMKKASQELYGLINYGELRKKQRVLNVKSAAKLNELVNKGSISLKVRGKTLRIKTPVCPALKRLNRIEDSEPLKVPNKLLLELVPKNGKTWGTIQALSQNPRVRIETTLQRTLTSVISYFENRWKSNTEKLKEQLTETFGGKKVPKLRFVPIDKKEVSLPLFRISEAISSSKISLRSYAENVLNIDRKENETILSSKSLSRKTKKSSLWMNNADVSEVEVDGSDNELTDKETKQLAASPVGSDDNSRGPLDSFGEENPLDYDETEAEEKEETPQQEDKVEKCGCGTSKGGEPEEFISHLLTNDIIKRGWTSKEAGVITLGELYLVLGQCEKLQFCYFWDEENEMDIRSAKIFDSLVNHVLSLKKKKNTKQIKSGAAIQQQQQQLVNPINPISINNNIHHSPPLPCIKCGHRNGMSGNNNNNLLPTVTSTVTINATVVSSPSQSPSIITHTNNFALNEPQQQTTNINISDSPNYQKNPISIVKSTTPNNINITDPSNITTINISSLNNNFQTHQSLNPIIFQRNSVNLSKVNVNIKPKPEKVESKIMMKPPVEPVQLGNLLGISGSVGNELNLNGVDLSQQQHNKEDGSDEAHFRKPETGPRANTSKKLAPKPFLDLPKGNRRIGRRPYSKRVVITRPLLPKALPITAVPVKVFTLNDGSLIALPPPQTETQLIASCPTIPTINIISQDNNNKDIIQQQHLTHQNLQNLPSNISTVSTTTGYSEEQRSKKPKISGSAYISTSESGNDECRDRNTRDPTLLSGNESTKEFSVLKNMMRSSEFDELLKGEDREHAGEKSEEESNMSLSSFLDISLPESTKLVANECLNSDKFLDSAFDNSNSSLGFGFLNENVKSPNRSVLEGSVSRRQSDSLDTPEKNNHPLNNYQTNKTLLSSAWLPNYDGELSFSSLLGNLEPKKIMDDEEMVETNQNQQQEDEGLVTFRGEFESLDSSQDSIFSFFDNLLK